MCAGEVHAWPGVFRLEAFLGLSQWSAGDWLRSQGGAGLLEAGGASQGASTLALSSVKHKKWGLFTLDHIYSSIVFISAYQLFFGLQCEAVESTFPLHVCVCLICGGSAAKTRRPSGSININRNI